MSNLYNNLNSKNINKTGITNGNGHHLAPQPAYDWLDECKLDPNTEAVNIGELKFEGENSYRSLDKQVITDVSKISTFEVFSAVNTNAYNQLKSHLAPLKGGPYLMDGRDGNMRIHNYDFYSKPKFFYTYAGGNGEMLSCRIRTERTEKEIGPTENTQIDADSKKIGTTHTEDLDKAENRKTNKEEYYEDINGNLHRSPNQQSRDFRFVFNTDGTLKKTVHASDGAFETEEAAAEGIKNRNVNLAEDKANLAFTQLWDKAKQYVKHYEETGDIGPLLSLKLDKQKQVVEYWVKDRVAPYGYGGGDNNMEWSDDSRIETFWRGVENLESDPNFIVTTKRENMDPSGHLKNGNAIFYYKVDVKRRKYKLVDIDPSKTIASINPKVLADAIAENRVKKATIEQLSAFSRVVGRPQLESSMNIDIQNISDKYSGKWHIKKVKHSFLPGMGFICEMDLIRQPKTIKVERVSSYYSTVNAFKKLNNIAKKQEELGGTYSKEDQVEAAKREIASYRSKNKDQGSVTAISDISKSTKDNPYGIEVVPAEVDAINVTKFERDKVKEIRKVQEGK